MTSLLNKRISGLSQSITDLLVRQKQVTVGFPRTSLEVTISRLVTFCVWFYAGTVAKSVGVN